MNDEYNEHAEGDDDYYHPRPTLSRRVRVQNKAINVEATIHEGEARGRKRSVLEQTMADLDRAVTRLAMMIEQTNDRIMPVLSTPNNFDGDGAKTAVTEIPPNFGSLTVDLFKLIDRVNNMTERQHEVNERIEL